MLFLNIKALKVSFFCRIAYSHITHCSYIPHICSSRKTLAIYKHCTKKKFSIKDLFNKYDQIRKKLQIWSNLLEEILNEKLWFFCAVKTVISFSQISAAVDIRASCFRQYAVMSVFRGVFRTQSKIYDENFFENCF